jgi:hypothetical protein
MSDLGETTNLERNSLEAHVDLCAMRYRQLDTRLSVLETKMDAIQKDIVDGSKSLRTVLISSSATLVSGIVGLIVVILMKF